MVSKTETWTKALHPLDMNGMAGRMAVLPAPKNKRGETLFLYDRHSSLDQWRPVIEYLNRYGAVTAPDLPGFGGMDSFYSIGRRPTINAYADYLAAFFKLRFRRKQVTVVAVGFGFVVLTRMLQRYPALARHVGRIISVGGYARHDDVQHVGQRQRRLHQAAYRLGSSWLAAKVVRYAYLNRWMLPRLVAHDSAVMLLQEPEAKAAGLARAIDSWRRNDLRTRFYTAAELLRFDNCARPLSLPLWHVRIIDTRLGHMASEQRMRVIFDRATFIDSTVTRADFQRLDDKLAARLISAKLRQQLSRFS